MKDQKTQEKYRNLKNSEEAVLEKKIQYSSPSLHPQTSEISMGSTCYFWRQLSPEPLDKHLSGTREVIHYQKYTFVANL